MDQDITLTTEQEQMGANAAGILPEEGAPVAGTEGEQTQEQAPAEIPFDPSHFGYKYKQQELFPKDRSHAIALMQKGHSYESAMAEIKTQRGALDERGQRLDTYQKVDDAFKANPQLGTDFNAWFAAKQNGQPIAERAAPAAGEYNNDPAVMQTIEDLKGQISGLSGNFQEIQDARADGELEKELTGLREKYADEDWTTPDDDGNKFEDQVMIFAMDKGLDLDSAYKLMNHDTLVQRAKSNALVKSAEDIQQQHADGTIMTDTGVAPAQTPVAPDISSLSYDQLIKLGMKDVGQT